NPNFTSYSGSDYQWTTRFTGRELDLESGLINFRYRLFSPQLGRFVERDPLSYPLLDTLNLYAYVSNRTLNVTDPWGLQSTGTIDPGVINPGVINPGAIAGIIAALRAALLAVSWWNIAA